MSWLDRVNEQILFKSPKGSSFSALWVGNERTRGKKLGIFTFPLLSGSKIQDLDLDGDKYPLNFYFEGADHDREGERFWNATSERGRWQVTHPVWGKKSLQLQSITHPSQPVESGNITAFQTEWLEPLPDTTTQSTSQLKSSTKFSKLKNDAQAIRQFADKVKTGTARARNAVTSTAHKIISKINSVMSTLTQLNADVQSIMDTTQTAIDATLAATVLKPITLASQIKILVQTPALAVDDIKSRFGYYRSLADEVFEIEPLQADAAGESVMAVKELTLIAILGAMSDSASSGTFDTRPQAVAAADDLMDFFDSMRENIENQQDNYSSNRIDRQYIAFDQSYPEALDLLAATVRYLLTASADLRVEKKIVLDRPKSPIQVTVEEYGTLGDNDANLDFFIATNKLKNTEILLLPAGREVVVYG